MYLGAAHGYPFCLECTSVKNNIEVIKVSCEKLFDLMYSTGNLPSSYPRNTDKLVQWCHGGPGAIYLAIRCANVFKDDKYNNFAAKMADDIWVRGLLLKGSGLCHGVSGNAYSFLAMYAHTDDKKYLYRAYMEKDFHLSADEPYSLFEGLAGTLYFLCDLYKPKNALFPGFQTTIE